MPSLFHVGAQCPLFTESSGAGLQQAVAFQRATHGQTRAGDDVLSFASSVTVLGSLQPYEGSYPRLMHGVVVEIDSMLYVNGRPDVAVGDRCRVDGQQMECVSTQQYGDEHCEISLKQIGR